MALTPQEVAKLAELARIDLTPAESEHFATQLDVILDSVASVTQVASADVAPTSHALGLTNVFRADEVAESLTAEQALAMAPAAELDRFRVPRILDEE